MPPDVLDASALEIAAGALDSAVEQCGVSRSATDELRLATARHIIGLMQSGERDHVRLERSAVAYIENRFR